MYHKMLVILDGSEFAEVVFTYAQEVSARLGINLELLHVCNPQEAQQLPMRQAYINHMAETLQKKAAEIRAKLGEKTGEVQAKGAVVVGYPAEEILKYTNENNIDIIMLSTHGRSGVRAWDIGNVANKVIHASDVPIWVVPTELKEEIIYDTLTNGIILIPLDGSTMSEAALPHVINLAKQKGAEPNVVLVNVHTPMEPMISPVTSQGVKNYKERRLEKQQYLDNVVKRLAKEGIKARAEIIIRPQIAKAVIDFIRQNPTQLLIMATHGHAGLSKMVFGSVAEELLHLVKKTPILLVKP